MLTNNLKYSLLRKSSELIEWNIDPVIYEETFLFLDNSTLEHQPEVKSSDSDEWDIVSVASAILH